MSKQDKEEPIHAFISSRLNYCDGLFSGLSQEALSQLQLIQNATATALTKTKKAEHIIAILSSLHWLPVSHRLYLNLLLVVYESLNGLNKFLPYFCHMRPLRSFGTGLLPVSRTKTVKLHLITMPSTVGVNYQKSLDWHQTVSSF